jgi:protein disulfide-isomerase
MLWLAVFLSIGSLSAAEATWLTDYKAAQKKATAEHKPILMDFTGSDWCGWCIRLDKEVFSQPEFVDYAQKNLVLLKVDFPRNKEQTEAEKIQNQELAGKFGIQGYPTIILIDSHAKQLGEMGYEKGGAAKWVASLEKIMPKK